VKPGWLTILPLILTLLFFGVAGFRLTADRNALDRGVDTQAIASVREGRPAPDLDLRPLADTPPLTRADLEGNGLVIVNFWASWCPPCRAEHPVLTDLAAAGNPLFGVNYRDRADRALRFLDELGNPYDRIGRDEAGRVGIDWGVVAMPETFFVDTAGTVVLHFRGPVTRRALDRRIMPALAEAGHRLAPIAPPGAEAATD